MKHMLTAAVQMSKLFAVAFTKILQADSALSHLMDVVFWVVVIGSLVKESNQSVWNALQAFLVFSYQGSLASSNCNANGEAETPHEHADEHVEEESNAEHPDEETVHSQILFVFLLERVHLVGEGDAVDSKSHQNQLEHVRSFDEEFVVLSKDQRQDVVHDSEQVQAHVYHDEIEAVAVVLLQAHQVFVLHDDDYSVGYQHQSLPHSRLEYRFSVVGYHILFKFQVYIRIIIKVGVLYISYS